MEETGFAFVIAFCVIIGIIFYNLGRGDLQGDFKTGKCFAVNGEIACK